MLAADKYEALILAVGHFEEHFCKLFQMLWIVLCDTKYAKPAHTIIRDRGDVTPIIRDALEE